MLTEHLARVRLSVLPTPLQPMEGLTRALGGPRLWVKRDDLTSFGGGGNKVRKLEFLVGEALRSEADTLITAGAAQSNHVRQTAAAAAHLGIHCIGVLGGEPPQSTTGNLLLDHLFGAEIRWAGKRDRSAVMAEAAEEVRSRGGRPYVIPIGGSNEVGAVGYAEAMAELLAQAKAGGASFDRIAFATSSGGTQAGLVVGAHALGYAGEVLGISIDQDKAVWRPEVRELVGRTADRLRLATLPPEEAIVIRDQYIGPGYGVMTEAEKEAIILTARREGILLDPVYTGRAMAGLIDLIRRGEIGKQEKVLFWHTGGAPALFVHAEKLLSGER